MGPALRPAVRQHAEAAPSTPGDTWHLDEVFVRIRGKQHYLRRAIDQHGHVLDILVQGRRNTKAAMRFFRKRLRGLQHVPRVIVTDELESYAAARRGILPGVDIGKAGISTTGSRFRTSRRDEESGRCSGPGHLAMPSASLPVTAGSTTTSSSAATVRLPPSIVLRAMSPFGPGGTWPASRRFRSQSDGLTPQPAALCQPENAFRCQASSDQPFAPSTADVRTGRQETSGRF